jgi:hypothetical protein
MVVLVDDKTPYIIRKRLDEIITHSEDEGWDDGEYPRICFVLKDGNTKNSFLYTTNKKLESMGFDEDEVQIIATSLKAIKDGAPKYWSNALNPKSFISLFE